MKKELLLTSENLESKKEILTTGEVLYNYNMSRNTLYKLEREGVIKSYRWMPNSRKLWKRLELDAALKHYPINSQVKEAA